MKIPNEIHTKILDCAYKTTSPEIENFPVIYNDKLLELLSLLAFIFPNGKILSTPDTYKMERFDFSIPFSDLYPEARSLKTDTPYVSLLWFNFTDKTYRLNTLVLLKCL